MSKKKSTKKPGLYQVILMNDNKNTYEHVVECLMEICGHNYYQAVQCATITNNVKQCAVCIDTEDVCRDVCHDLMHEGLTAVVTKKLKK